MKVFCYFLLFKKKSLQEKKGEKIKRKKKWVGEVHIGDN